MIVNYAGVDVDVNEEGFLNDLSQWTPGVAEEIAKADGIDALNEQHWAVIKYLQEEEKKGTRLSIRNIKKSGVVTVKEFYQLFPGKPLKLAAKVSGIPKPVSCI